MTDENEEALVTPESPGMTAFEDIDMHAEGNSTVQQIWEDGTAKEPAAEVKESEKEAEGDEVTVPGEDGKTEEEPEAKTEEKAEAETPKEDDAAPEPEVDPPNVIKTSYNDEAVELYGDLVIPTNVAGKEQNPTLQDLRENFSGKVNWDKKFQDLASNKKEFETSKITFDTQKNEMNQLVNQLVETARGDDPFQFFDVIAEMMDVDPVKLKEEVVRNQAKQVEPIAHMDDDEKEQYFEKLKLGWERQRIDRFKRAKTQEEESARNNAQVNEVREKYGLSDDDYREAFSLAEKNLTDGAKPTVDQVVWIHRHQLATEAVHEARADWVKGLDASSETDVKLYNEFIGSIRNMAVNNPEFKQDDLKQIISEAFSDSETSAKVLSKRATKSHQGARSVQSSTKPKPNEQLISFEQLDGDDDSF